MQKFRWPLRTFDWDSNKAGCRVFDVQLLQGLALSELRCRKWPVHTLRCGQQGPTEQRRGDADVNTLTTRVPLRYHGLQH